jgi:hypothetical protein
MIVFVGTLASEGVTAVTPPITVVSVVAVIVAPITVVTVVISTMIIAVDIMTQWVFGA